MSTLPAFVPFPSSGDTENIIATRGGKRTRRNALIGGQSASKIDGYTSDSADGSFNAGTNGPSGPSECQSPPRITILTNPARTRARLQSRTQDSHSPSACQSSPRSTIFSPPVRTRPLPSIQATLSSSVHRPAPRFTILTNPARAPPSPSTQNTQNSQDASVAALNPKPALPLKSILKASRPTQVLQGGGAAAAAAPKQARPTRASAPASSAPDPGEPGGDAAKDERDQLPTIIIHEPVSWDVWVDVDRPGTSKGGMLGVPKVNVRGKLRERDIARYYPNERDTEQIARRLRSMARSGSRSRRRDRTRQRRQTIPTATLAPTPTPTPTPAPAPTGSSLATPITGDS